LLLVRSSLSVNEISRMTGFSATFELSRAFAAVYGVSPRAYRRLAAVEGRAPDTSAPPLRGLLTRLVPDAERLW
jgi:AraC-like DNA-binding protein